MKLMFIFILFSTLMYGESIQTAYLAGGCFWCMEEPFEKLDGVEEVISGYAGGKEVNPVYNEVASGTTGHREAVKVIFDSELISYNEILDIFWRQINPTDSDGQFVDRGFQYSTAIFYVDDFQKEIALTSKEDYNSKNIFNKDIVTPIVHYTTFYPAEDYHQDYYKKKKARYKFYRKRSGRDKFLNEIWN